MTPSSSSCLVDAAARSVGADEVAGAIARELAPGDVDVHVVRNGSRGMFWLEPLVEVSTPEGRVAYGPVQAGRVAELVEAGLLDGAPHRAVARQDRGDPAAQAPDAFHLLQSRGERPAVGGRLRGDTVGSSGLRRALEMTPQRDRRRR